MFSLNTNGRTVWVEEMKVEKKNAGLSNEYDAKSILFCIASNRPYSVTKKDAAGNVVMLNGLPVKERPTDFMLCKATSNVAQIISDHCSTKKTAIAGQNEKVVSRFLSLAGYVETYKSLKPVKISKDVAIKGENFKIDFDTKVEVDAQIFIVTDVIDFLDSKPVTEVVNPKVTENITVTAIPATTINAPTTIAGTEGSPELDENARIAKAAADAYANQANGQKIEDEEETPF